MDEITEELAVEQLNPPTQLRVRPVANVGCRTDIGRVRENNEDKLEFYLADSEAELATRGHVFLVCDGMGGHEAGQIASELALKTFLSVYLSHPSAQAEEAAVAAVQSANRFVLDVARAIPKRAGMGTTLSGLLLIQDRVVVVQVGDSRVYRLRDGELDRLTVDHTWVEEAVASGMVDRASAEQHPYRHMLTRAIGSDASVKPDVLTLDLQAGDTFLVCSDGVTNHVTDEGIQVLLAQHSPSQAALRLVESALAGGGSDNASAIVVRVDRLEAVG